MAGLNKTMHIVRLGRDPEIKYTQAGQAICNFTGACSEKYKDKNGQVKETTEWINFTAWDKNAETIEKYLKKGSLVFVEGKMKTDTYDKDGQKHYSTKITVQNFQFLDGKGDSSQEQRPAKQEQRQQPPPMHGDDMGLDIPF